MLGATSKMNRDPAFLNGLIADGTATAGDFVTALAFEAAWRAGDPDVVWAFFADNCRITSEDPFPAMSLSMEADTSRRFVIERLAGEIQIDLTRRQFASDQYLWRVRFTGQPDGDRRRGQAAARFQSGNHPLHTGPNRRRRRYRLTIGVISDAESVAVRQYRDTTRCSRRSPTRGPRARRRKWHEVAVDRAADPTGGSTQKWVLNSPARHRCNPSSRSSRRRSCASCGNLWREPTTGSCSTSRSLADKWRMSTTAGAAASSSSGGNHR